MGNLDFSNEPMFSWYCVLLFLSGIAMLCMIGVPTASKGARIANLVFGAGFTFYAFYLVFMFEGGHYFVFFKAFILPIVLIAAAVKSAGENRRAKTAVPYQPPMVDYGQSQPGAQQPYAQPQPSYTQPYQQAQPPQTGSPQA